MDFIPLVLFGFHLSCTKLECRCATDTLTHSPSEKSQTGMPSAKSISICAVNTGQKSSQTGVDYSWRVLPKKSKGWQKKKTSQKLTTPDCANLSIQTSYMCIRLQMACLVVVRVKGGDKNCLPLWSTQSRIKCQFWRKLHSLLQTADSLCYCCESWWQKNEQKNPNVFVFSFFRSVFIKSVFHLYTPSNRLGTVAMWNQTLTNRQEEASFECKKSESENFSSRPLTPLARSHLFEDSMKSKHLVSFWFQASTWEGGITLASSIWIGGFEKQPSQGHLGW